MSSIPLGLYIHLPWCERKCPYCDFNSHEAAVIPETAYVEALLRDLQDDLHLAQGRPVDTLFIGGGTPSLFSAEAIERLLAGVGSMLELSPTLEATMEANPGSAEADKFAGFRAAGINRLSLGVQSFDDQRLHALGRVHDSTQALAAADHARAAKFDSINIDLMHGLPGQTVSSATQDLRTAIELNPTHLSWYQLTIEPNTVFHKRPPLLPVEDALAGIQEAGEQLLSDAGLGQYEVSAYSQPGFGCRHNLNYWTFGDYLGIGAGAHGKISNQLDEIVRYHKTRLPADYLAAQAGAFTAGTIALGREDLVGEFMLNALRLNEGFTCELFEARTGLDSTLIKPKVEQLKERGLLLYDDQGIRTSAMGRRFLDSVVAEFFLE